MRGTGHGTAALGPLGGFWRLAIVVALVAGTLALHGSSGSTGLGPLRATFTLLFLGFGPGLALMGIVRLDDLVLEISLAVALSLALDTIVATGMTMLHHWVPTDEVLGLAVLSLAGVAVQGPQVFKLRHRLHQARSETA
jgi:peptidoglycan/LPS O-acetylase OafA/YrhL